MVIEKLDTTSLGQWLLGPHWAEGVLLGSWALAAEVLLLALAAWWAVRAMRRGPLVVGRRAALAAGLAAWSAVLVVALLAAMWQLDWTIVAGKAPPAADAAAAAAGAQAKAEEPLPEAAKTTTATLVAALLGPPIRGLHLLLGPQWYEGAFYRWLVVVAGLVAAVFVFGWLVAALRSGPVEATACGGRALVETVLDLARTSPRRVLALAWLAFRDSLRRRALVVFAVFLVLMAFAGWFIAGSEHPGRLYLQVVLTTTGYLMLGMALFLSALSLPADIKDRTIQTLVTKPVRPAEIVLGRLLGFTLVGTLLLAGMGLVSYVFTVRGLSHTHALSAAQLDDETRPGRPGTWKKGLTSMANGHQHEVTIDPAGNVEVEVKQDHTHEVFVEGSGDSAVYRLGPPQGQLVARVPIYGKLRFTNNQGQEVEKGVNVGDEWMYRSFVEGGTKAAAIWTFTGIDEHTFPESMFPDAIPVEMTIEVFRLRKGDIEKPIHGELWVRNPQTQRKILVHTFGAKKYATDTQWIPRTLLDRTSDGRTEAVDLFGENGMVSRDGRLEIILQCMEPRQFFGAAQPDLYLRARDASFVGNFAKGFTGLWLQMLLVLTAGVVFSTFLSAPVAMLATLATVVGGLFSTYIAELAAGKTIGGGPFESFIRMMTQQNQVSPLEKGLQTNAALMGDQVMQGLLHVLSSVLPAFERFDLVDHVAYGFDVNGTLMGKCVLAAAAFVLPALLAGYFFLKVREVGK
jgi:ABC-type transport system involved in multi-copper enzyme maturation permease subunit